MGGHGLYASIGEYMKFIRMWLNDGAGGGGPVALSWLECGGNPDLEARLSRLCAWVLAAERVARPFEDAAGWTGDVLGAKSENDKLHDEIDRLRQQLIQNQTAARQNAASRQDAASCPGGAHLKAGSCPNAVARPNAVACQNAVPLTTESRELVTTSYNYPPWAYVLPGLASRNSTSAWQVSKAGPTRGA